MLSLLPNLLSKMRRVISLFLLLLMALTTVQTTWTMHFCGGSLRYFGFATGESGCCCGSMTDDEGCEKENTADGTPSLHALLESCCSDYTFKVSTDDYCPQEQNVSVEAAQQLAPSVSFLSDYPLNVLEPESQALVQHVFPPGAYALSGSDLLSLICILRI